MAVIEPVEETAPPSTTTRTPLPKPPPRSGDFSYDPSSSSTSASSAPRDLDATLKSWDSVPLFMKDLPNSSDSTDVALEALQSLAFDGSPNEVAAQFKTQANDYFTAKRFREALGFYTQAIDSSPTDTALTETLHANRAACHLELQNYGMALRDTSRVLELNGRNEKAYYRATRALIALGRDEDAVKCATLGLEVNPENEAIRGLKKKAEGNIASAKKREEEKAERERRKSLLEKTLHQALLVRGLWLETTPRPPDNPKPAHFDPETLSSTPSDPALPLSATWSSPDPIRTPLILPLFLIYPLHSQSDFISDYHEDTPLSTYLSHIFPPSTRGSLPWDTSGEYYDKNLQVYAETRKRRLLKLGKKLTLREVMDQAFKEADEAKGEDRVKDRDGLVMKDGILSLYVLPRGEAEGQWVERFKREREKSK
ncbi:Hsp70/Hsp90 co-chaperone CNS1 [Pseudozyma hubeiensis]|nr:Hsp70/Hsp90 co-chaperone CNS1 [Pseudozyma hubeiensis]